MRLFARYGPPLALTAPARSFSGDSIKKSCMGILPADHELAVVYFLARWRGISHISRWPRVGRYLIASRTLADAL